MISGLFSMTWSPHLYGDRLDEFTREVNDLLAASSPNGLFWDWPGDTQIVLAHKPG
ncbi:MAG: hypothetical protein M3Z50_14335 [Actinomycetota bacterium]|nr:hypothetical protein [Actinomycetota bacterium]